MDMTFFMASVCMQAQGAFSVPLPCNSLILWRRHNLKRKLANLAPITVDEFEQRMQTYIGGPAEKNKKKEHLGTKAREKAEKRAAKKQERNEVRRSPSKCEFVRHFGRRWQLRLNSLPPRACVHQRAPLTSNFCVLLQTHANLFVFFVLFMDGACPDYDSAAMTGPTGHASRCT
jgi:hypothetical protein